MRPQHNAAENAPLLCLLSYGALASMRPQHNAAENDRWKLASFCAFRASMRPQHNAAENLALVSLADVVPPGFNEAAA